ncbi:RpnC/YadD family protein [Caldicellulosiruptor changbaiensis]|uniref:hypothetical protein n=1 Tax=Caldicellulosiruptor changbaiensis TaxID=1222016 RepID=UPI0019D14630|nr:hypothetical protein [Caldicellulosiruptor changbaiensis]
MTSLELDKEEIEEAKSKFDMIAYGGENIMPLFQNLRKIREDLIHEGIQQGIQQGIEQGLQKGMAEGFLKGIEKQRIETAEKMIAKGYSDDEIEELTGLSREKIKELRAKYKN